MNRPPSQTPWLLTCALAALALGPIWLLPRDFWDGVIGAYGIARGDFSGIRSWLLPSNWGLVYLLLRAVAWLEALSGLPSWVWIKLLISASVVALAHECRLLCQRLFGWNDADSRWAQWLVLSFPCWYVLYGSTFVYLVFVWGVFASHRWLHDAQRRPVRAMGFLLLLLSFQVNANFVMVCALEAARWLCPATRPLGNRWRSALVAGSALAVYLASRLLWPPSALYQGYNQLVWPGSLQGALTWLRALAIAATWLPLLLTPAALAWAMDHRSRRGRSASTGDTTTPRQWLPEAAALLVLTGGALLAYIAVGKGAPLFVLRLPQDWFEAWALGQHAGAAAQPWLFSAADGWSMRHAFLFSIPAAMGMVWLVRRAGRSLAVRRLALALAVLVNLALLAQGHAAKQLRAAQELAIVRALAQQQPPPMGTLDLELRAPVGWAAWTYEVNYLLWLAYAKAQWAGALYGPDAHSRARALAERQAALAATTPQSLALMDELDEIAAPRCHTHYAVQLPAGLSAWSPLAEALGQQAIAAAQLQLRQSLCDL